MIGHYLVEGLLFTASVLGAFGLHRAHRRERGLIVALESAHRALKLIRRNHTNKKTGRTP